MTRGPAGTGLRSPGRAARRWYGAHPLHLLALVAAFCLAGYAVRAVVAAGQWRGFALWFAVAIIGHDLVLFPLYSLADVSVRRLLPRQRHAPRERQAPPVINYVRVPAGFSLLLLLVWFPLILGLSASTYHRASGLASSPYLWRWLGVTGVLFAGSAFAYSARMRRAVRRPAPRGAAAGRRSGRVPAPPRSRR